MTDYEKWKDRYDRKWCTKEQLSRLVKISILSEQDYKEIVGKGLEG